MFRCASCCIQSLEPRTLLAAPDGLEIQVMTQNLFFGAELEIVMGVTSADQLPAAVSQTWDSVVATDFPSRAAALAKDIVHAGPALIGLQEAALWMSESPAGTQVYDFVQLLTQALEKRGTAYVPVAGITDLAAQLPDDRGAIITFVDRDVILARADMIASGRLQITDSQSANYFTRFSVPIADTGASLEVIRGWTYVDAAMGGQAFRFINTHLESYVPLVQYGQAMELVAGPANTTLPTIIAGDFNSDAYGGAFGGPDATPTYAYMLANGFEDAWGQTHKRRPGLTWGQSGDLRNVSSTVSERIDYIFVRNGPEPEGSYLLNWKPGDRTNTRPRLWGSDHAGLFATIDL